MTTVGQLIDKLSDFNKDLKVTITDGYSCKFYDGKYGLKLFREDNGEYVVDLGVGGTEITE